MKWSLGDIHAPHQWSPTKYVNANKSKAKLQIARIIIPYYAIIILKMPLYKIDFICLPTSVKIFALKLSENLYFIKRIESRWDEKFPYNILKQKFFMKNSSWILVL